MNPTINILTHIVHYPSLIRSFSLYFSRLPTLALFVNVVCLLMVSCFFFVFFLNHFLCHRKRGKSDKSQLGIYAHLELNTRRTSKRDFRFSAGRTNLIQFLFFSLLIIFVKRENIQFELDRINKLQLYSTI